MRRLPCSHPAFWPMAKRSLGYRSACGMMRSFEVLKMKLYSSPKGGQEKIEDEAKARGLETDGYPLFLPQRGTSILACSRTLGSRDSHSSGD